MAAAAADGLLLPSLLACNAAAPRGGSEAAFHPADQLRLGTYTAEDTHRNKRHVMQVTRIASWGGEHQDTSAMHS